MKVRKTVRETHVSIHMKINSMNLMIIILINKNFKIRQEEKTSGEVQSRTPLRGNKVATMTKFPL